MASTIRTDKIGPVSGSADFTLPTADGTVGQFIKTDGSKALSFATVASAGFNSVQVFTASGTYTVPTGVTKQVVYVTGGGGGGGLTTGAYGATAGGGAGTVIKFLQLAATSTVTVAIGAAGGQGAAGNVSTFTTASGTSFTALTGPAGQPGVQNNRNASPTLPSGCDMNLAGGAGGGAGNMGGSSFWGGGGPSAYGAVQVSAVGVAFGSGGGGGSSNTSYHAGSAGAAGVVFVMEYK